MAALDVNAAPLIRGIVDAVADLGLPVDDVLGAVEGVAEGVADGLGLAGRSVNLLIGGPGSLLGAGLSIATSGVSVTLPAVRAELDLGGMTLPGEPGEQPGSGEPGGPATPGDDGGGQSPPAAPGSPGGGEDSPANPSPAPPGQGPVSTPSPAPPGQGPVSTIDAGVSNPSSPIAGTVPGPGSAIGGGPATVTPGPTAGGGPATATPGPAAGGAITTPPGSVPSGILPLTPTLPAAQLAAAPIAELPGDPTDLAVAGGVGDSSTVDASMAADPAGPAQGAAGEIEAARTRGDEPAADAVLVEVPASRAADPESAIGAPATPAELYLRDLEGLERALGDLRARLNHLGTRLAEQVTQIGLIQFLLAAGLGCVAFEVLRRLEQQRAERPQAQLGSTSLPGPFYRPRDRFGRT